ncbi:hypothetical protein [Psychroserpens luteolus]|uniref:hypothetical protein n=1 Tax=Psychroserpens luteolus TaxID=2855840 RepID=UPI001E517A75|nr:hypothetical protein [Psychroserpens luteolus]MCD2260948.1 hypothetical protein [Psychroserpens luteolus]
MAKYNKVYKGDLKRFTDNKIYINVNYLKKGVYDLHIVYKNKVVKQVTFKT